MPNYSYELLVFSQTVTEAPFIDGDQKPIDDLTFLPSVYTDTSFTVDVEFRLKETSDEAPEPIYPPMNNFTATLLSPYTGVTFTELTPSDPNYKKLRISGTITGGSVGSGESYEFVLDEAGYPVVTVVPAQIPNNFLALTAWNTPGTTIDDVSPKYMFSTNVLNISTGETITASRPISQYIYWGWIPALAAFQSTLAQGKV